MKLIIYLNIVLLIMSCTKISPLAETEITEDEIPIIDEIPDSLSFFDVMTWNIEQFPIHDNTTSKVISIIDSLSPKIIAFQEINDQSEFNNINSNLIFYDVYRTSSAAYGINLAFMWDTSFVKNVNIYEILSWDSYALPRAPLVMECRINNLDFIIINNHLKCCDDGFARRQEAIIILKEYTDQNYNNDRVILLGDLNDNLNDPEDYNVFTPFLDDRDSYLFVDEYFEIEDYSYPSYPSHIDHILISSEIYDIYNSQYTVAKTILLDETVENYFYQVSDHLPVYLKLVFEWGK